MSYSYRSYNYTSEERCQDYNLFTLSRPYITNYYGIKHPKLKKGYPAYSNSYV